MPRSNNEPSHTTVNETIVENCQECDLCHGTKDDAECCVGEEYGRSVDWAAPPPYWCPLRPENGGPMTIRLAEGV
jgi:hypothetical protein